ncbi:hypothetical protein [Deinococcus cellulosilyticus]|uniref:Uncharacterized protein n=1 Tax=Deinococcus cellulosilyticus (strain DSM 18568 / NBRC 106333 / KACC 11606 / 5516J-15) TaxID=1223518 RepID=A0A511N7Y5_DEIC1|nr:hypothetical protein [Deinococcus cellulosilyticus]GEM48952.1 hypothetical protein DC3_45870 [Deinococcus cellulosilyticus NBRC 106333 = KACC 11606]
MLLVVQVVSISWGKKHRGAEGGALVNRLPLAVKLPALLDKEDKTLLHTHVLSSSERFKGRDVFESHDRFLSPFAYGEVRFEREEDRYHATYCRGYIRKTFGLESEKVYCFEYSRKTSSEGVWIFHKVAVNVAMVDVYRQDLFVIQEPDFKFRDSV